MGMLVVRLAPLQDNLNMGYLQACVLGPGVEEEVRMETVNIASSVDVNNPTMMPLLWPTCVYYRLDRGSPLWRLGMEGELIVKVWGCGGLGSVIRPLYTGGWRRTGSVTSR